MSAVLANLAEGPAQADAFARDVLAGLSLPHKAIPATWLYDRRGCALFEQITTLPEYHVARAESWILEHCAAAIAAEAGPGAALVELGSGSSRKTSLLLGALDAPSCYLPIEPSVADFGTLQSLPQLAKARGRWLVFVPGPTIGNFAPEAALALLERIGHAVGPGALMAVGTDTSTDPALLIPAYDDARGVAAAFNRNLLLRMNRELGADFAPSAFRHEARWDAQRQRIEMHLVSEFTQRATVRGRSFRFARGESIHTENSYKYGVVRFQALARRAGWTQRQLWTDGCARFAVHVLERAR